MRKLLVSLGVVMTLGGVGMAVTAGPAVAGDPKPCKGNPSDAADCIPATTTTTTAVPPVETTTTTTTEPTCAANEDLVDGVCVPKGNAPVHVDICHVAGLASDPANYIDLNLPENAVYGQAGHFYENGTPQAGHEQDTLGTCSPPVVTTTTTTTPVIPCEQTEEGCPTTTTVVTTTTTTPPDVTTTTEAPPTPTETEPPTTTTTSGPEKPEKPEKPVDGNGPDKGTPGTAFTGPEQVVPLALAALGALSLGSGLMWAGRRRDED